MQRRRKDAPISVGQGGNCGNQGALRRNRRPTQLAPALRCHRQPLTTAIVGGRSLRDKLLIDQPLNDHRYRALMGEGQRRHVVDRCAGVLGDLLQRKPLRASQSRRPIAGTGRPQCLDDVPKGVERHAHVADLVGRRGAPPVGTGTAPLGRWTGCRQVGIMDYMGCHTL